MEWLFWIVPGLFVAAASAAVASVLNRRSPERTIRQILDTIFWLTVGTFILTVGGCIYFLRMGCPPKQTVCDAPAMAAGGIVLLGAITAGELIVIGIPLAYATVKMLRRR